MVGLTSRELLFLGFAFLVVGAAATAVFGRHWRKTGWLAVAFAAASCAAFWWLAARVLASGPVDARLFVNLAPLQLSPTFHVDVLSVVFLFVATFVGLAATLYAVAYMPKVYPRLSPAGFYPFALLLTASMAGVVTSSDLFFFFIFWEAMTLTSWVLVWFDRENETKVRAAWVYFVVIHAASACMLVAAIVLFSLTGSFSFREIAAAMGGIAATKPALFHLLAALFFIAFATKAGMFPLGGWLPEAHPAAPAPASAVFSGAMIKMGIYAIVRVFLELFRTPDMTTTAVWGGIIATLGAISIFVGTITALRQDDVKRVLSFHSIGQIGYMLLGVGTGIFFLQSNPLLAALALIAGLYHVINHACFKSLLFMNAGATEYYTGTRDLNLIGGLGKLMPITMVTAIIASLSIAGIPPLNGFVSKWLIYHSTVRGGMVAPLFLVLFLAAIFSSIATLASFMKVLGAMFLGQLATNGKEVKGDVPASMTIPQIAFSAACVLLGVAPILPLLLLYKVAQDVLGSTFVSGFAALFGSNPSGITLRLGNEIVGVWNPAYALVALVFCALLAYGISRLGHAPVRETAGWYGGEEVDPEHIRFRAHGFVLPFKEAFAKVYPSVRLPKIQTFGFMQKVLDLDTWLYGPIVNAGSRLTGRLSRAHSGIPQMYMLWQVIGIIAVLALLFIMLK